VSVMISNIEGGIAPAKSGRDITTMLLWAEV